MIENNRIVRTPEELARTLSQIGAAKSPPVEKWDPQVIVNIDISINRQGQWIYNGSPIHREEIVKLFASILVKDEDERYFLVTPVEKAQLKVEDAPFVVTEFDNFKNSAGEPVVVFSTNIGEKIVLSKEHGIRVQHDAGTEETIPYLQLKRGMEARIGRNVFYDLVDLAEQQEIDGDIRLMLRSQGETFEIGRYPA